MIFMYNIIQKRKIWLSLSGLLVAASVILLVAFGLNFGIDFTGGGLMEIKFLGAKPTTEEVKTALADLDLKSLTVQPAGEDGMLLRFQDISEEEHQEILKRISGLQSKNGSTEAGQDGREPRIDELRFDSVGPSIGEELKRKSVYAIFFVLIAIVLYIAWAFRKVSKPIVSWKYGVVAIITLFHDVLITIGVFVILGKFFGMEVNTPFVAAILTVIGYSVNDTIVVFDRIRENLPKSEEDFESTINTSVNQTVTRSINTSATTLAVLLSIVLFGGHTIQPFALALSIGVFVGTYSSIFLASPLLVVWEKWKS